MTTLTQSTGLDSATLKALGRNALQSVLNEFLHDFKLCSSCMNYAKLTQAMIAYQSLNDDKQKK